MIKIKKIERIHKIDYSGIHLESEENFIKRVEEECSVLEKVVSTQFVITGQYIDSCIITYRKVR